MANIQSQAAADVIALVGLLTAEERAEVIQAIRPTSATAEKIAKSGFRVGETVTIATDAKSVSKKLRGLTFTITKVCGERLWGDNPFNADEATGRQIDPNKQIWVKHEEVTRVGA